MNSLHPRDFMRYSDLRLLSEICFAIGGISGVFDVIAYFWEEKWFGWIPTYPYRDYAFPLVFLGIVFAVIGWYVKDHARREETSSLNLRNGMKKPSLSKSNVNVDIPISLSSACIHNCRWG
jgi:hypothetical protein